MPVERGAPVLAIDPGREKCGLAVVDVAGRVLARRIVPTSALAAQANAWAGAWSVGTVVVGCGTGSGPVCAALRADGLHPVLVVETGTTLAARALFYRENPPTGWRRFIPRGLLVPPEPLDDFAAVLIARSHLGIESAGPDRAGPGQEATAGGANGG